MVVNQREFEEPSSGVRSCYLGFFGLALCGSDTAPCCNLVLVINRMTVLFLLVGFSCVSFNPSLVPDLPSHRPSCFHEPLPGGGSAAFCPLTTYSPSHRTLPSTGAITPCDSWINLYLDSRSPGLPMQPA